MDLLGLDRLTRCSALELGYLWIGFPALRAASGCNRIFHNHWVPNNASDSKHATIPSNTFMPSKDGSTPRDISSLYGLVRLLHRHHNELFPGIPRRDGFVLQDPHFDNDCDPSSEYVIPDRSDDYCIPPRPCDLQVRELAPSRRHVTTSPFASNGPVGEGDNPYSNVAPRGITFVPLACRIHLIV